VAQILPASRHGGDTQSGLCASAGCRSRVYHRLVPIYEFRCESCGERFDALVEVGTESEECRLCGVAGAARVYSAQAAPFSLVKTPGAARRQEASNAKLRAKTKADFKTGRQRAREARKVKGDG
jgi:putative FmdB family regulatory protein